MAIEAAGGGNIEPTNIMVFVPCISSSWGALHFFLFFPLEEGFTGDWRKQRSKSVHLRGPIGSCGRRQATHAGIGEERR